MKKNSKLKKIISQILVLALVLAQFQMIAPGTASAADIIPPEVSFTSPAHLENYVGVSSPIQVNFTENIMESTNFNNIAVYSGGTPIPISPPIISNNVLTITPLTQFAYDHDYSVVIPASSVMDTSFNNLAAEYTFTFRTELFAAIGQATQLVWHTQPGNAQTGAILAPQPRLYLEDVGGNIVTSDSTSTVTLHLTGPAGEALGGGETLGGTVTAPLINGVATFTNLSVNQAGTYTLTPTIDLPSIDSHFSSTFTITDVPGDVTPPSVMYTSPVNLATYVPVTSPITVTFDETINPSLNFTNISVYSSGLPIELLPNTLSGNVLTIRPVNQFAYDTDFLVKIPAGAVKDIASNDLPAVYTFTFHTEPANVNSQTAGYSQIIAGGSSSGYALKPDGTVWAWGYNFWGQLGNNSEVDSLVPVQVYNLSGVTSIAAGYYNGYALNSDGTVWAWGLNNNGQLGNNSYANSPFPVQVCNLTNVVAIAAGYDTGYALKSDGTVWAWGNNSDRQLGDGSAVYSSTIPVQVSSLTGVTSISAGYTTGYASKSDGTAWAWGSNIKGQLGNNSTTSSPVPVQVSNLTGVTAVVGGPTSGYALKSDGTAWAWGYNGFGELGNNSTIDSLVPVLISNLTSVTSIAAGYYSGYALKSDGTVWAWGTNNNGQLGNGSTSDSLIPIQVLNLSGVRSIASGYYSGYALKSDGTLWAWGANDTAQLGNNSYTNSSVPVQVLWTTSDIVSTSPAAGSTGVSTSTGIDINFQKTIQPESSLAGVTITANGGTTVNYTYTTGGNNLHLTPTAALQGNTIYTVSILAGAVTYSNYSTNTTAYSFSFTTQPAADVTPPTWAVSNLTYSNLIQSSVTISWPPASDNVGVSMYGIYQGGVLIDEDLAYNYYTGSEFSYTVTGLYPGQTYTLSVRAMDTSNNWSPSGPSVTVTTLSPPDTTPPTWPNPVFGATITSDDATLAWDPADDPNGVVAYSVYRISGHPEYSIQVGYYYVIDQKTFVATVPGTTYSITGLTPETFYEYKVEAVDASGNWSNDGPRTSFTTPAGLAAVDSAPYDGSLDAPLNTPISVYFSEGILQSTSFGNISLTSGGNPVTINPPSITGNLLTITPVNQLVYGTDYQLTIPAGAVMNYFDDPLAYDYILNFSTMTSTIRDPELVQAVRLALQKPTGDITQADLSQSTFTSLSSMEGYISDLEGLQYATNLSSIALGWNYIRDLSPLSGLTKLTHLELGGNKIKDLSPISGLTGLSYLELGGNEITDLSPLSGLKNLNYLSLESNLISYIQPLAALHQNGGLPSGSSLYLAYNFIDTTVSGAAFNVLENLGNTGVYIYSDPQNINNDITYTYPLPNSAGASIGTNINITFRDNISPGMNIDNITIAQVGGGPVNYTDTMTGPNLTLTPDSLLKNTTYIVTIPYGAVMFPGYYYNMTYSFNFTTQTGGPSSGPRMAYIPNFSDDSVTVVDIGTQSVAKTIYGLNQPWAVAVNPKGNRVYVTNLGNNSISVINPLSNTIMSTVYGITDPRGAALSPDGTRLYIANYSVDTVSVIDTATNQLIGSPITVGANPLGIVVSPDGTQVYVANSGSNYISIIDTSNNAVSARSVGTNPYGLDVTPDGSQVYVTNDGSSFVSVINTGNQLTGTIDVGLSNQAIVVSPDGKRVYTANYDTGKISVIDTYTNTVTGFIYAGTNPNGISVSSGGGLLAVANYGSNNLSVFDTNPLILIDTVQVGTNPAAFGKSIKMFPPRRAYIPNNAQNTVSIIDAYTDGIDTTVDTAIVGTGPYAVAITPDGWRAYVTNYESNTVSVIDVETNKVITSIPVGPGPAGVAVNPQGTRVYVADYIDNSITAIDTSNNSVVSTINLPENSFPQGIMVSPGSGRIYTTNPGNNTVSIINTVNNTVENTVYGFSQPRSFATVGDGSYVYVTNSGSNAVSMLDTRKQQVVDTVYVGSNPYGIAATPDGTRLFVANYGNNTVTVIDAAYHLNNVITSIGLGSELGPVGIAVTPDGKQIYVVNSGSNTVSLISTTDYSVLATFNVGINPTALGQFIGPGLKAHLTPPAVKNAVANGYKLKLSYDRILDETVVPGINDFSVYAGASPVAVNDVTILGTRVDLTLATPVTSGQSMTLSYTPGTKPVQEVAGQTAAGFTALNVWTNTPVLQTAYATDGNSQLDLYYNEPLNGTYIPSLTDYTVTVNEVQTAVTNVQLFNQYVRITIDQTLSAGQNVVLTYTPGTTPLRDPQGVLAAPLNEIPVEVVTLPLPVGSSISGVTINGLITVPFNQNITEGYDFSNIVLHDNKHTISIPSSFSISGSDLIVSPTTSLNYDTSYFVVIPAGAIANIQGYTMASQFTYGITTELVPPPQPLAVVAIDPANSSTEVRANKQINVKFNRNIIPGAYITSISLTPASSAASVSFSYNIAGDTLTLIPSPGLKTSTTYYVTIPAGTVTDYTYNGLASNYTFSFSTSLIGDANLESAIRMALNKAAGIITTADMARSDFTVLNATNSNISDLSGLTHAVNLKKLYLSNNLISDLSPLAGLTGLEELWLDHNKITAISTVYGLTNLKWLYLSNNTISDVTPLSDLKTLQALDLNNNTVSNVTPLGSLTSICDLGLANNKVSSITELGTLVNLQFLDLQAQKNTAAKLSNISAVAKMPYLRNLLLNENNIMDLSPLQNLTNLKFLTLWNNGITDTVYGGITPLSGLSGLTDLWLDKNNISDLTPLAGLTNLQALSLAGNPNLNNISSLINNAGLGLGDYVYLPPGIFSNDAQTLKNRSINVTIR